MHIQTIIHSDWSEQNKQLCCNEGKASNTYKNIRELLVVHTLRVLMCPRLRLSLHWYIDCQYIILVRFVFFVLWNSMVKSICSRDYSLLFHNLNLWQCSEEDFIVALWCGMLNFFVSILFNDSLNLLLLCV